MRKFKVGDLVTVVEHNVWYTHLRDGLRENFIGRTGTVVAIDELTFTKEDKEWYKCKTTEPETVYDCTVRFPWIPERPIVFSEAHLKAFSMEN